MKLKKCHSRLCCRFFLFYEMCLYIVWISERVQIFIWLHFSWYLRYLIIFVVVFVVIYRNKKYNYVWWAWRAQHMEKSKSRGKSSNLRICIFCIFIFFVSMFWQIMTSSAKDHQPNKVDYTFYSSMMRNKEQKQKCVI